MVGGERHCDDGRTPSWLADHSAPRASVATAATRRKNFHFKPINGFPLCAQIRYSALACAENVGSQFLSLRQPLSEAVSPRSRGGDVLAHEYRSLRRPLCTGLSGDCRQILLSSPKFSEALYLCPNVRFSKPTQYLHLRAPIRGTVRNLLPGPTLCPTRDLNYACAAVKRCACSRALRRRREVIG